MSEWVTVCEFSLQDDLSEVAAFIQRHQLPLRISEERNRQQVASLVPQLVEPMRQLLQRWQAGEVDLSQISVHVYEEQQAEAAAHPEDSVANNAGEAADSVADAGASEAQPAPEVPPSAIPQWRLGETPLCILLIALCFIGWLLLRQGWAEMLVIFPQQPGDFSFERSSLAWHLAQGEYWRLWSPAMVHFSLPHALFNSLGIWIIGRSLEARAGSLLFALLVVVSALASNLVQYWWSPHVLFGGMSGVVYALVGAAFVIQRWQPAWHDVPGSIIWLAVVWLLVCMSGVVDYFIPGGIANAAHLGGFAAGLVMAFLFCLAGGARRFAPAEPGPQRDQRTF
ncbi:rhomboid family intramembrane serine protease [uncultured Microbulbifer sp.]|uniref:rhomboid family intramembrane serine protease n=1 Tax=uncultured Microbulbifer sp. TaxID=348147 RepID=UPI0025D83567|nr:rhomboid family intramembrane serine protease [uncultured Microbulbifer sp.]